MAFLSIRQRAGAVSGPPYWTPLWTRPARGYAEVRLDVIDNNPRARTLYERRGFVAGDTQYLGPLKYLFGFSAATTMVRTV